MSGILGQILGSMLSGQAQGQAAASGAQPGAPALMGILQQVLSANGNGLGSLVSQLQGAGLGSQVGSWVGNGTNQPVTPDQIGQVFSADQITGWAAEAGTTPEAMRQVLAEALPHAVDHVTPAGAVPAQDAVPDFSALLGKLLGGASR
jgi:uncharacterized protein YidB (DUF937 family)